MHVQDLSDDEIARIKDQEKDSPLVLVAAAREVIEAEGIYKFLLQIIDAKRWRFEFNRRPWLFEYTEIEVKTRIFESIEECCSYLEQVDSNRTRDSILESLREFLRKKKPFDVVTEVLEKYMSENKVASEKAIRPVTWKGTKAQFGVLLQMLEDEGLLEKKKRATIARIFVLTDGEPMPESLSPYFATVKLANQHALKRVISSVKKA